MVDTATVIFLKDHMRETQLQISPEKKYIEVIYDDQSQALLREFCNLNGFDLSIRWDKTTQDPDDFDFHSTIWYTQSEHQLANRSITFEFTASPTNFALFGENQNILVLEIDSEDLHRLRNYYGRKYAMQDQYPDYRPHITVCYAHSGGLPDSKLLEFFT